MSVEEIVQLLTAIAIKPITTNASSPPPSSEAGKLETLVELFPKDL